MGHARLIVCEQTSRWANALRWLLPDASKRMVVIGDCTELHELLTSWPKSVVVLELNSDNAIECCTAVQTIKQQYTLSSIIVASSSPAVDIRWTLFELGAHYVVGTTTELVFTTNWIRKRMPADVSLEAEMRHEIRKRMPWSRS